MKDNGLKIALTIFFVGLCAYYLFPTAQNIMLNQRLSEMTEQERIEYEQENFTRIQEIRQGSLGLGLDLLGGMHVTLEIRVADLIGQLAINKDETFEEVLQAASRRALEQDLSVIDVFIEEFQERDPNVRLSRYFRNEEAGVTRRSENSEVIAYLRDQSEEAVERAIEIVRNRVDRYGVTEPSIQRQGDRRIIVELPGVDDPERVRDLLRGTARLEFRLMANPQRLTESVQDIIDYFEAQAQDVEVDELDEGETPDVEEGELQDDPIAERDPVTDEEAREEATDPTADPLAQDDPLAQEDMVDESENPFLALMQPLPYQQQRPVFAHVLLPDTSRAMNLMRQEEVQRLLPSDVELMFGANPIGQTQEGVDVYELIAVRSQVELAGDAITDASVEFDQFTNEPKVLMVMDSDGSRTWARLTGANVGEPVAVALDGVIYSYPTVQQRILGGRSEISGLDSRQEAQDIVTILQSGALPAPLDIVGDRTVGPSLGEASIRAGFISVISGLVLVVLFMVMYYRTAGIVANVALLLNIVLILGILAGFGATLTLPGIAGIVLTIGMAVDANVLIFDRIREEANTGKTLKASIDAGYDRALSAILDANITTFFVGAILYSFGVGPIQGFAVTLMAGILSSLFTAIIVTRIIFDYMVNERKMRVSYG
ncbi:MAG: protein translocase subunit SecD [Longimonas sp.]|uniref:protein translocase subunit SecD n=1 Tax=Longimonas sp. TaxID=2039626 RepID=UPI003345CBBF